MKAGWKKCASVSRAQPGLDGWNGQSGGGKCPHHYSLSPVALPYTEGARLDNLKWSRLHLCQDLLGNLGSTLSCSMDA